MKMLCDASIEKGEICILDDGGCKNSGVEYELNISKNEMVDCFNLCKGCSKKLKKQAENLGFKVSMRKLSKIELKNLVY